MTCLFRMKIGIVAQRSLSKTVDKLLELTVYRLTKYCKVFRIANKVEDLGLVVGVRIKYPIIYESHLFG